MAHAIGGRLVTVGVACCIGAFCALSLAAEAPEDAAMRVMMAQKTYFQRIQSIDSVYRVNLVPADPSRPRSDNQYRFVAKGDKFLHETTRLGVEEPPILNAFNGKFLQRKDGDAPLFFTRSLECNVPDLLTVPMLSLHMFAIPIDRDHRWAQFGESNFWEGVAAKVKASREEKWDNHVCEILTIKGEHPLVDDMSYEVYFAKDLDYFPVRVLGRGRATKGGVSFQGDAEVKEFMTVSVSEGGTVIIPIKVVATDYDEHGKLFQTATTVVDKALLKVNAKVEESLFTIHVGPNDRVFDRDLGKYVKPPLGEQQVEDMLKGVVVDTYVPPPVESKVKPSPLH